MKRPVTVYVLRTGKIQYDKGVDLQCKFSKISADSQNFRNVLILTEHFPVYTVGIRTKDYTKEDEIRLKNLGAEFYKTNRGGLITFHGPGQLVAYPVLNLKQFIPKIRWYVSNLEATVIDTCNKFNLKAMKTNDTGIWVGNNKICAVGVHGSRYVTTHGIGLNCTTDLSWFDHIVPCGIKGKGVTSLSKELGKTVDIDEVTPKFLESFSDIFECNLEEFKEEKIKDQL